MSPHMTPFRDFLLNEQRRHGIDGDLIFLLEDIASACRIIAHDIQTGAFSDTLGSAGSVNVQDEEQKALDLIANDVFIRHCSNSGRVAALVSEEDDDVVWLKSNPEPGDYLVYFDPLDGSSNVDVNLSVGSIFSIVEFPEGAEPGQDKSVLRKGREQICAGYSVYGPSTSLVLSTGHGVNGFTLRPETGEFLLTFADMKVPSQTIEYAINASYQNLWETPVRQYIDDCTAGKSGPRGQQFKMRWTGSMVADVHRILTRGGVFLYPQDAANRKAGGKLRLLYEANPMGFLIEQAGGIASTGRVRILDVEPQSHHQRVSVILGSSQEVELIEQYHSRAG